MKSKTIRIILGVLFLTIFTAAYMIRFISLNRQYPETVTLAYSMNQPISYYGIELQVTDCKLLNETDLQKLGDAYEKDISIGQEMKCIVAQVQITNPSKKEKTVDLSYFTAESGAWRNGINPDAFKIMNEKDVTLSPKLKAGETTKMKLTFTMNESQFGKNNWNFVNQRHYQLVLSLYPYKRTVQLM